MSDLETRIRDALRADEIEWADLRQPTLRGPSRQPRRWPTVLATAAAVAVVATVASVIAGTSGNGSTGPAAAQPAYAGYAWRVIGATDRRGSIPHAASVRVQIAFSDTAVSATLFTASIFGHYQATPHGYHLTDLGIAGRPTSKSTGRTETRLGDALGHMFINAQASLAPSNLASVTARVSGDQLVLRANGVTLRLSRQGPARLSPMINVVGYTWRVEALTDDHGQLTIPNRLDAALGFSWGGGVRAKDTVNTLTGEYGLTSAGYVVTFRLHQSLAGYAGHDPTVLRLKAALDAMVANHAAVTAAVAGKTLTLSRGATTLKLHRGDPMRSPYLAAQGAGSSAHGASSAPGPAPRTSPVPAPPAARPAPASGSASASASPVRHARGAAGSHH